MRRQLIVIAAVFLGVPAVLVLTLWGLAAKWEADALQQEKECCWPEGATFTWTSRLIGIRAPETATDRRAGYKVGQRLDSALLVFTLPTKEADAYFARLLPEGERMTEVQPPVDMDHQPFDGFRHFGLPEPETISQGMRRSSFCPDSGTFPGGEKVHYCVTVHAHAYAPGSTRIYVKSTIEPSVTPPPAAPAAGG
ncbi:hypothetical protein [Streptomyces sp. URMC 123]|uniref:hypothetical protein n=1 Tax=Streptomyces sp. URMC 123 TaxID=3423403 RepID=UPI003F1D9583